MGDTDTYAMGPLLIGGGVGYAKPLGEALRLVADINMLVGIPVVEDLGNSKPGFGINLDGSLGLQVVF